MYDDRRAEIASLWEGEQSCPESDVCVRSAIGLMINSWSCPLHLSRTPVHDQLPVSKDATHSSYSTRSLKISTKQPQYAFRFADGGRLRGAGSCSSDDL